MIFSYLFFLKNTSFIPIQDRNSNPINCAISLIVGSNSTCPIPIRNDKLKINPGKASIIAIVNPSQNPFSTDRFSIIIPNGPMGTENINPIKNAIIIINH